jgi:hypothetical protein
MTTELETKIAKYQKWRENLRATLEAYQAWLEGHGHADIQRSLRIYDLVESLKSDRIILALRLQATSVAVGHRAYNHVSDRDIF